MVDSDGVKQKQAAYIVVDILLNHYNELAFVYITCLINAREWMYGLI